MGIFLSSTRVIEAKLPCTPLVVCSASTFTSRLMREYTGEWARAQRNTHELELRSLSAVPAPLGLDELTAYGAHAWKPVRTGGLSRSPDRECGGRASSRRGVSRCTDRFLAALQAAWLGRRAGLVTRERESASERECDHCERRRKRGGREGAMHEQAKEGRTLSEATQEASDESLAMRY